MKVNELRELVKVSKPFFDVVRIYDDAGASCFQSIDSEKTVLFSGTFKTPIPILSNGSVGINRFGTLDGMLRFAEFNSDGATMDLVVEEKNGTKYLSELEFKSPNGYKSNYRFMGSKVVDSQIQVPPFKGATFDVEFRPTQKLLSDLSQICSMMGGSDTKFTCKIATNGKLQFHVGDVGVDRAVIPVCDTTGSFKREFSWSLSKMIAILKLAADISTVYISGQGVIKIEFENEGCLFTFLMPAIK